MKAAFKLILALVQAVPFIPHMDQHRGPTCRTQITLFSLAYPPEHPQNLGQDLLDAADGAQHQGAHHHVHAAVWNLMQVLTRGNHRPLELEVLVLREALEEELAEIGIGVGAGEPAAWWVELEIGAGARADFQQGELARRACKCSQVAEQGLLLLADFMVVGWCHLSHDIRKNFLIEGVPQAQVGEYVRRQDEEPDAALQKGGEHHLCGAAHASGRAGSSARSA